VRLCPCFRSYCIAYIIIHFQTNASELCTAALLDFPNKPNRPHKQSIERGPKSPIRPRPDTAILDRRVEENAQNRRSRRLNSPENFPSNGAGSSVSTISPPRIWPSIALASHSRYLLTGEATYRHAYLIVQLREPPRRKNGWVRGNLHGTRTVPVHPRAVSSSSSIVGRALSRCRFGKLMTDKHAMPWRE
jgi:hypothetical protein